MLGVGAIMMVVVQAEPGPCPFSCPPGSASLALMLLAVKERRAGSRSCRSGCGAGIIAAGNLGGLAIGALLTCVVGFLPTYVQGAMGRTPTSPASSSRSSPWCGAAARGRGPADGPHLVSLTRRLGRAALIERHRLPDRARRESTSFGSRGRRLVGFGMGFCNTTFLLGMQASVGWNERGVATSSVLFMRTIGQSLARICRRHPQFRPCPHAPEAGEALGTSCSSRPCGRVSAPIRLPSQRRHRGLAARGLCDRRRARGADARLDAAPSGASPTQPARH